jgi:replicative DNA helicase
MSADRHPPHSPEAEVAVLGCCLLAPNECIGDALLKFRGNEVFYDLRHGTIWHHIVACYEAKIAVDVIVLHQRLRAANMLEEVGGLAFLAKLPDAVPSVANLAYYLDQVFEKFMIRKLIATCTDVVSKAYACEGEVMELMGEALRDLTVVSEAALPSTEKTMHAVMCDVSENVLEKFRRGIKMKLGPQTGFNYLDNIVPGFQGGQLIVEAARPRTGKSAKMMQVAEHIALVEKIPVALFSLEMTARSLGARAVFQRAGADYTKFCNGFMVEADVQRLMSAGVNLSKAPIHIDESSRMCIEDFEVRARRLVRNKGVGIIFVDYFQLLYVRNAKRQWSKSDELAEVSMRLKGLAKELNVPIYLAAQMNRQIEQDVNRRPRLSDLRDTGQLEQDADMVFFLWKPQPPEDESKLLRVLENVPVPGEWKTIGPNKDGRKWSHYLSLVTCTVEKQREGRSGEDSLMVFIKPWTRFVDAFKPRKDQGEGGNGEDLVEAEK